MDRVGEDARSIGYRIRRVRESRQKSLRVTGGLAGLDKNTLSRVERGERHLTLHELHRIADALGVAPSELTKLPVPAPVNGHIDAATEAVRLALDAIQIDDPCGIVVPLTVLQGQVTRIHAQRRACQFTEVGADLPSLMRNLHTTLAADTHSGELLNLAVKLHTGVTKLWLARVGAPADLVSRISFLTHRLAKRSGDAVSMGMAAYVMANTLLSGGAYKEARSVLNSVEIPPVTADNSGLFCEFTICQAALATMENRLGDMSALMEEAMRVARRFGSPSGDDSYGIDNSPSEVATYWMWLALEANEPDRAVSFMESGLGERNPYKSGLAFYWIFAGRALARIRGKHDEAVIALRKAEELFPVKVRRDPMVRDVLSELVTRARRDAVGRELRGMAYRAGIDV